jgi:hypothetical protein
VKKKCCRAGKGSLIVGFGGFRKVNSLAPHDEIEFQSSGMGDLVSVDTQSSNCDSIQELPRVKRIFGVLILVGGKFWWIP